MGKLYQLQASSPLASRTDQAYTAVTGMSYSPYGQPWCLKSTRSPKPNFLSCNFFIKHDGLAPVLWLTAITLLLLTVLFTHAIELECCIVQYLSTMLSQIKVLC